jgi:hypothetical protein
MANTADPVALYEKLVATLPGVERKGDTIPYASVNGPRFSNLTRDGRKPAMPARKAAKRRTRAK